jgi:hypothetical protein
MIERRCGIILRLIVNPLEVASAGRVFTDTMDDESGMVRMHSGDGEHDEMDQHQVLIN